jgi:hypothetical protein
VSLAERLSVLSVALDPLRAWASAHVTPSFPVLAKLSAGKGKCCDDAAVEAFPKTIKAKLIWRRTLDTCRRTNTTMFQYINGFRNPRGRNSALEGQSPVAFERKVAQTSTQSGTNT